MANNGYFDNSILGNKPIGILLGYDPASNSVNVQRIGDETNLTTRADILNENLKDLHTINLGQICVINMICKIHQLDAAKRMDMFDDLIDILQNAKLQNNSGVQVVSAMPEDKLKSMFNKIK